MRERKKEKNCTREACYKSFSDECCFSIVLTAATSKSDEDMRENGLRYSYSFALHFEIFIIVVIRFLSSLIVDVVERNENWMKYLRRYFHKTYVRGLPKSYDLNQNLLRFALEHICRIVSWELIFHFINNFLVRKKFSIKNVLQWNQLVAD